MKIKAGISEIEKINLFLDLIIEKNKYLNITGTKEKDQVIIRHFIDCLSIFQYLDKTSRKNLKLKKIIDIGTGGGLPGILLAIFLKNSEIYLLDSKNKIIEFLKTVIDKLGLENTTMLKGRAEDFARAPLYRESFDLVVSRAFGKLSLLSEIAVPFCKIGGRILFYKSRKVFREIEKSKSIILQTGAVIDKIMEVQVPLLDEYRSILILKKERQTLYNYPRKYAKMLKMD